MPKKRQRDELQILTDTAEYLLSLYKFIRKPRSRKLREELLELMRRYKVRDPARLLPKLVMQDRAAWASVLIDTARMPYAGSGFGLLRLASPFREQCITVIGPFDRKRSGFGSNGMTEEILKAICLAPDRIERHAYDGFHLFAIYPSAIPA